jgi:hypothetical protein
MRKPTFRFRSRRFFLSAFWFAVAVLLFAEFPRPAYPELWHLLAFVAALGAGAGAIVGRAFAGAAIAVIGFLIYGFTFPDPRE